MAKLSDITSTQWTLDMNNAGEIVQGVDSIKQCVYVILMTERGSDPLRPDFGCSALEYIDLPSITGIPRMVKAIHDALEKYEPRIENVKVLATMDESAKEKIKFTVSWKVKNTTINDQTDITYG